MIELVRVSEGNITGGRYTNGNSGCTNGNGLDIFVNDKYPEAGGYAHMFLPDGDIKKGKRDPYAIGKMIVERTGLPYATDDFHQDTLPPGILGQKTSKYVVVLTKDELKRLGYPTDELQFLVIEETRPQNIPGLLATSGYGITGLDIASDAFEEPMINGHYDIDWFIGRLKEKGIIMLTNLGHKPTGIYLTVDKIYTDVRNHQDLKKLVTTLGRALVCPTEYPAITAAGLRELAGLDDNEFKIVRSAGHTEQYVSGGHTPISTDTVETGDTLINSDDQKALLPALFIPSTPFSFINARTRKLFPRFFAEVERRLQRGIEEVRSEYPEYFKLRINPVLLGRPEHANTTALVSELV